MCVRLLAWLVMAQPCHDPAAVSDRPTETPAIVQLSGTDWRIHEDAGGKGPRTRLFAADPASPGWIPATVPGNIQADLEAAHQLQPLWYGAGDPRLPLVAAKDWWYRKDFTIPASFAGKRLTLVFDGVDQHGEVWLNGQAIGSNTGMFKRFQFDVTPVARPGQPINWPCGSPGTPIPRHGLGETQPGAQKRDERGMGLGYAYLHARDLERRPSGGHRPGADRLDARADNAQRGPRQGDGDRLPGNRQRRGPARPRSVPGDRPRADGPGDGRRGPEEGPQCRSRPSCR